MRERERKIESEREKTWERKRLDMLKKNEKKKEKKH